MTTRIKFITLDLKAQTDGPFAQPSDDPFKAVEHAETFAFSVSTGSCSWRKATPEDGNIRHTALVLGDGYPTVVVSAMHRRVPKSTLRTTPPKDVSGYEIADEAEFDYHVGSTGYSGDLDKALLHAIAARNGMDINDIWRFVDFTTRVLRPSKEND